MGYTVWVACWGLSKHFNFGTQFLSHPPPQRKPETERSLNDSKTGSATAAFCYSRIITSKMVKKATSHFLVNRIFLPMCILWLESSVEFFFDRPSPESCKSWPQITFQCYVQHVLHFHIQTVVLRVHAKDKVASSFVFILFYFTTVGCPGNIHSNINIHQDAAKK